MSVKCVKPTKEMMHTIAEDMRCADRAEVWASNHLTPIEALERGLSASDFVAVITVNDMPMAMCGLVKRDILSGKGFIWMLATEESTNHKREFLVYGRKLVDEMLNECPYLCNMVHTKNTKSIRWLRWLGFTIDEPVKYGPDDELFHLFYLQR